MKRHDIFLLGFVILKYHDINNSLKLMSILNCIWGKEIIIFVRKFDLKYMDEYSIQESWQDNRCFIV